MIRLSNFENIRLKALVCHQKLPWQTKLKIIHNLRPEISDIGIVFVGGKVDNLSSDQIDLIKYFVKCFPKSLSKIKNQWLDE